MADSGFSVDEGVEEPYMGGWPFSFDFSREELEDVAFWNNFLSKWNRDGKWKQ